MIETIREAIEATTKSKSPAIRARRVRQGVRVYLRAVRNIMRAWDRVSKQDMKEGMAWYPTAAKLALTVLRAHGCEGTDGQLLGVVAACSPRSAWPGRNLQAAINAIRHGTGHTAAVLAKVRAIMGGADVFDTLGGPKTQAFWRNLTGDYQIVCIDGHMTWILMSRWYRTGKRGSIGSGALPAVDANTYFMLALAVQEAARTLGVQPAMLQAILWTWGKRAFPQDADPSRHAETIERQRLGIDS